MGAQGILPQCHSNCAPQSALSAQKMTNTLKGCCEDGEAVLEALHDFEKGQGGFLATNLLGKKSFSIYNNTKYTVKLQVDKDIFTDGGGGELRSGEIDGFARSGPTNVLVDGKNAGNLVPGNKYVIEPDGVKLMG